MATTIFPLADTTGTVARWAAMQTAIDRGDTDPLVSLDAGSSDTARLQFDSSTSGTKIDDTFTELLSVQIDAGQVYLLEVFILMNDATTSSPSDDLNYRISVPSGAIARGIYYGKSGGITTDSSLAVPIYTTINQTVVARSAASPSQSIPSYFRCVVVGDTGGGTVSIDWAKQSNTYANTFDIGYGYAMARRILG